MQLNLDMQISTSQPFLESHQLYLSQVAGFFIVEERVLRTADGLLSESQVETTWETAIAKITSILEEQFSRMRTASHLLLIKDYGPDWLPDFSRTRLSRCKLLMIGCPDEPLGLAHAVQKWSAGQAPQIREK